MDFPITVDTQEAFDELVKSRLSREKTKQTELQEQVEALTAEKQELETKASELESKATELESRATAAEAKVGEFESEKTRTELTGKIADEFKIDATVLRGSTEEELRAHAEALKPLYSAPTGGILPDVTKTPTNEPKMSPEHDLVKSIFGKD